MLLTWTWTELTTFVNPASQLALRTACLHILPSSGIFTHLPCTWAPSLGTPTLVLGLLWQALSPSSHLHRSCFVFIVCLFFVLFSTTRNETWVVEPLCLMLLSTEHLLALLYTTSSSLNSYLTTSYSSCTLQSKLHC